jgi:hypothetical protein
MEAATASRAEAQAWLPLRGEGSVAIQLQDAFSKSHFVPVARVDIGHINTKSVVFDLTYGVTDKFALDVSLPYIASKYDGPQPHPTSLDDGSYHSTFQDFRFALRYSVRAGKLAVAPFVGSILPSHSYQYYAHAAPGRRLHELQAGAYLAGLLEDWIPGGFVQVRVGYGFMQSVADVQHGRGLLDVEFGDFLTERFRVFAMANGQLTHGGIDIPFIGPIGLPNVMRSEHDRIDRTHFLNVGGGASFSVTDTIDVFGSFLTSVANRNGHDLTRGINVGMSWSFNSRGPSRQDMAKLAADTDWEAASRSLFKCVCQRGSK